MMESKFKRKYSSKLFSWKELEYLLNIRPLMTIDRLNVSNRKDYRWSNSCWVHDNNCYPSSLVKKLIDENICYLTDMSRCTKKINDFAGNLEREYELPVDAHIYTCRNLNLVHPFGIHFDRSHNVIVQCEGETNFKVWGKVEDYGQNSIGLYMNEPPILDVDMKEGDAIWIPAYYPHLATSKTYRLSVSFPIALSNMSDETFEDRTWIEFDGRG